MPIRLAALLALLWLALAGGLSLAQADNVTVPYVQTGELNVPRLLGWRDESQGNIAQFSLENATIRTALVASDDPLAAAQMELQALRGRAAAAPLYSGRVNLADGSWQSMIFDLDDRTTASQMVRQVREKMVVISFIESVPDARIMLLTLPQADDSRADAQPEMALALEQLLGIASAGLSAGATLDLPGGEWLPIAGDGIQALGMVFGNDSYIALQQGAGDDLAGLVDAYNRTLLGFFITPDHSLYLALGLAATFVILCLLVFSLHWRRREIRKDLALLKQLQQEDEQ